MKRSDPPLTRVWPVSRAALIVAVGASLATLGGDCDGDVVQDPTFRDWCSGMLCSWTLDSGSVRRVPTWNENDFGVSFTSMGTQISQATQEHDATCLRFSTIADIDPSAQMSLLVDFDSDGTIDFMTTLGASDWHKVEAEITAPAHYQGITFRVRKEGSGTAVLAEMRVLSTTGCTAPPVTLTSLRLGEPCSGTASCVKGLHCSTANVCVQCGDQVPCSNDASCGSQVPQALVCGPGQHLGRPGDPCALAADCASDVCDGASISSLAGLFGVTDAGCPTSGPRCDLDASLDGSGAACACILNHGGTCR